MSAWAHLPTFHVFIQVAAIRPVPPLVKLYLILCMTCASYMLLVTEVSQELYKWLRYMIMYQGYIKHHCCRQLFLERFICSVVLVTASVVHNQNWGHQCLEFKQSSPWLASRCFPRPPSARAIQTVLGAEFNAVVDGMNTSNGLLFFSKKAFKNSKDFQCH